MRIIAVDEDAASLERVRNIVNEIMPGEEITCFDSALSALASAREQQVDIAMRKGGISPRDKYRLERFEVIRHE